MNDQDRERSLDAIREAYAGYERDGRTSAWDRANPGYRRLVAERDAALVAMLHRSLPAVRPARLLDVGCGTGGVAVIAESAGLPIEVTGLDLLSERVAVARERAAHATFIVSSADRMPLVDASFDIAVAMTLFSSIPSRTLEAAVAMEIARVLRPGAWLIWYDIRYGNPWNRAVHGVSAARLAELFPRWIAELRPVSVLPPAARRLGATTPILYPALHALRPLRSHLVGRLRKPA